MFLSAQGNSCAMLHSDMNIAKGNSEYKLIHNDYCIRSKTKKELWAPRNDTKYYVFSKDIFIHIVLKAGLKFH